MFIQVFNSSYLLDYYLESYDHLFKFMHKQEPTDTPQQLCKEMVYKAAKIMSKTTILRKLLQNT